MLTLKGRGRAARQGNDIAGIVHGLAGGVPAVVIHVCEGVEARCNSRLHLVGGRVGKGDCEDAAVTVAVTAPTAAVEHIAAVGMLESEDSTYVVVCQGVGFARPCGCLVDGQHQKAFFSPLTAFITVRTIILMSRRNDQFSIYHTSHSTRRSIFHSSSVMPR